MPHIPAPLAYPAPDDLSAPFWDAAAEGRLLLRRSPSSGAVWFHGADEAGEADVEWIEASGLGVVRKIVTNASDPPEVVVEAALDEGAIMTAHVIGPGAGEVAIGERVRCVFEARGDGVNAPQFTRGGPDG